MIFLTFTDPDVLSVFQFGFQALLLLFWGLYFFEVTFLNWFWTFGLLGDLVLKIFGNYFLELFLETVDPLTQFRGSVTFLTFLCHFWPFKSLLEPFRELLRVSLRCPWSVLEVSLSVLKCPWSVLKCPWSVLKMSLNVLEVSLSVLEVTLSVLEVTSTWPSGMFYLETTSSFSDEGLILTCFKKGLILNCLGLVMCPDCHWSRC